jgi:hypothetical protein
MVVTLVIIIVLGMALFAINSRMSSAVVHHRERQAYYTALSSLDTISQWISSSDDSSEHEAVEDFLATVPAATENPASIDIPLSDLPDDLGECTVKLCFSDEQRDKLLITATATYAGTTETLSLTMHGDTSPDLFSTVYKTSGFSPSSHAARITELNSRVIDQNPVYIGKFYDEKFSPPAIMDDSNDIQNESVITQSDMKREARVESFWTTQNGSLNPVCPDILSANSFTNTFGAEDLRTTVVPPNGRLAVNPFRFDYFSYKNLGDANKQNMRFVSLDISQTDGKDVEVRLGGDIYNGEKYGSLMAFNFVDQYTGENKTANEYVEYLPNNQMLEATLEKGSGGTIEDVAIDYGTDLRQDYWYRQKWDSGTIYTQSTQDAMVNGGLQGGLVFTPFYQAVVNNGLTNDNTRLGGRYAGWNDSAHVTNPNYGQENGDFYKAFPQTAAGRDSRGMPSYPLYWGEDFSLYLLDNVAPTDSLKKDAEYKANKAWLQQGVNILGRPEAHSTVYSTRGLIIGSTQKRTTATTSLEYINTAENPFAHYMQEDPDDSAEAYFAQLRWGTLLYETDIVLVTPDGINTPRTSSIRRPLRYSDVYQSGENAGLGASFWRKFESYFLPKTQIRGGHIYIGAGQTLTIEGGTPLYRNPSGAEWSPTKAGTGLEATGEYTMHVAPDDITVAAGATLVIEASDNINITTSIYVDGGTLVIKPGAKIQGNISCYNNGEVVISGDFALYSPHDDGWDSILTPEEELDGIHIYGEALVGVVPGITAPGRLRIPSAAHAGSIKITGSSNKVHLVGPLAELIGVTTGSKPSYSAVKGLLCNEHDETDGSCQHLDATPGGWLIGEYGAGG